MLADSIWEQVRSVLEFWLKEEQQNLARVTMRVPVFSMPHSYETNTTEMKTGTVSQGSSLSHWLGGVRASLGEILPWLAHAYWYQNDVRGMARAALLLRFLFPEYEGPGTPDAHFAHPKIAEALGLKPSYVYEGVDFLGKKVDELLGQIKSQGAD
jgi:hypothetical protein